MKRFIVINEEFTCKNCGELSPKAGKTCRNHCRKCLYSLHVDEKNPGDRLSDCSSLMKPFKADQNGKKGWIISHKCIKCGKIVPNKAASDDNFDEIIKLTLENEQPRKQKTGR